MYNNLEPFCGKQVQLQQISALLLCVFFHMLHAGIYLA